MSVTSGEEELPVLVPTFFGSEIEMLFCRFFNALLRQALFGTIGPERPCQLHRHITIITIANSSANTYFGRALFSFIAPLSITHLFMSSFKLTWILTIARKQSDLRLLEPSILPSLCLDPKMSAISPPGLPLPSLIYARRDDSLFSFILRDKCFPYQRCISSSGPIPSEDHFRPLRVPQIPLRDLVSKFAISQWSKAPRFQ